MANITLTKRTLAGSAAALLLGGAGIGSLMAQEDGPQEAKPQMMAPDAGFIQQLSFADLVEEVSPAVVSIRTEAEVPLRAQMQLPPGFERMLPPELRDRFDREEGEGGTRRAQGQGSGFFIDANGHIVTNNHVIDGANEIYAVLENGDELPAELVGTDPSTDIAVLKVEPSPEQRFVRFATDADLRVGDYVLAVGNPFGLGGSVTSGIVSAIDRRGGASPYTNFIQIDASINRGNSGGPTFDLQGNVVGVNTAIISPTGGNVGIGLAVPAAVAQSVVEQLIEEGAVTRGWLGVSIGNIDDRLASALGLEQTEGALVQAVQPGSPAEDAGVQEGDVVRTLNGEDVGDRDGLTRMIGEMPPGEKVRVGLIRDGERERVTVTLGKRDPGLLAQGGFGTPETEGESEKQLGLGVTLSSLTEGVRDRLGLDADVDGALVSGVERGSEAEEAGFREGMVLTRADNMPVTSPNDVEKAVEAAKKRGKDAVLVRVQTSRQGAYFLAMPVNNDDQG